MDVGEVQHTVVINLDRRPDRWEAFVRRVPDDWPFPPPRRWPAVDGRLCPPPQWWRQGAGAWGAYRSHLSILEHALQTGWRCYIVLEDDATFCQSFSQQAVDFLRKVPEDAEWIYLGGQLLHVECCPPIEVAPGVYTAFNVHRAHAYILRGRPVMERLYRLLCDVPWPQRHHVDHRMGVLHEYGQARVYVPARWLVAQGASRSDVAGRDVQERWWGHPEELAGPTPPVVAVCGPFRSGTSCVAAVLHAMGVPMGLNLAVLRQPRAFAPRGTWEAPRLGQICRQAVREPDMTIVRSSEWIRYELRRYIVERVHAMPGRPIGMKHPSLCLLLPELASVWPRVLVVAVNRELDAAIRSGLEVGWLPTAPAVIPMLRATRDRDLERLGVPHFVVQYEELLETPLPVIERLAAFCGVELTEERRTAALQVIDPQLCHHGGPYVVADHG